MSHLVFGDVPVSDLKPGMVTKFFGTVVSVGEPYREFAADDVDTVDVVTNDYSPSHYSWWADSDVTVMLPAIFQAGGES